MKNGFRVPAEPKRKEQIRNVETELKNIQMASRISQMMTQQLMQSVKSMSDDLGNALNQLYQLQYKYTAIQKFLNLPVESLDEIANQQRLVDFNEAAAKADIKDNLLEASEVGPDSVVTFTTLAKDDNGVDKGILRSRLKLAESGVPELIRELAGKKVGDKVKVTIDSTEHQVELLGIKNPVPVLLEAAVPTTSLEVAPEIVN